MKKKLVFLLSILMFVFLAFGCDNGSSSSSGSGSNSSSGSGGITGASCISADSVTVEETIVVSGGVYDGKCKTFNPTSALGTDNPDGNPKPVFRVENGATLKNVIIGDNGADGIHLYNSATLDNITWQNVGEDALTVKSEGTYDIRNIEGYDAGDKFFQINAPCTFNVTNAVINNAGTMLRQNGGNTFTIHVSFDRCDISDIKIGGFRSDSSTSTAQISNSQLTNAGKLCIGSWASCGYVDGGNHDSGSTDIDDTSDTYYTRDTDDTSDTGDTDNTSGSDPASSVDLIVASDGSGDFRSVQNAVKAAPSGLDSWYTIYIKNGKYHEVLTVPSDKTYIRLVGQSADKTVITYDNYASRVGSTSGSATAFFKAKNFIAKNITFENSFDYNNSSASNKQAVAAEPMADRQVFVNCRFTGYQDTLYVRNGRSYFKNCFIQGHTDFIFGDGTAVFDGCEINSRPKNGGCISAPSTLASTAYGLIFLNCNLTGTSAGVWLGRPWHPSATLSFKSNAVYKNCTLGSHIAANGWTSMMRVQPSTERMYEYKNSGPGAQVNASRPQLSASKAAGYTVSNILRGSDNWNPASLAGSSQSSGSSGSTSASSTSSDSTATSSTFSFLAAHSGKALDVWEWGTTNGTNIAQYDYQQNDAQKFSVTAADGRWYRISPIIASGQAIGVAGTSSNPGANIQTYSYWEHACQQWRFENAGSGTYNIINRNSGLCLTVENASMDDGANVVQDDCVSGAEHQLFKLVRN